MITEDFAYHQLHDQWEYIQDLKIRIISESRRSELMDGAIHVYKRWQTEVNNFINQKRKKYDDNKDQ